MPPGNGGKKPATVSPINPAQPFEVLRLTPAEDPEERVHVFSIGDADYTMPRYPDATIALEYMEIMAQDGDGAKGEARAMTYLFKTMLGDEGYAALKGFRGLKMEHLAQLYVVLQKHSIGALEVPKGTPASA